MKRTIELKHVGPKEHVRQLIDDLLDRLDAKLAHYPEETVSVHALFEENGTHKLYRASLTCHVPGHMAAAHEESREAGLAIRKAFSELERQLEKCDMTTRRRRQQRKAEAGDRQPAVEPEEDA